MHRISDAIANAAARNHKVSRNSHFQLAWLCLAVMLAGFATQPLYAVGPASPRYAYVADNVGNQVLEYSITPRTGVLVPLGPCAPAPLPGVAPSSLKVDPTGRFLYVVGPGANFIWMFNINPANGCLILPALNIPIAGLAPVHISLTADRSGQFLYLSEKGSGTIEGFYANPVNGVPVPVPAPNILPVGPNPEDLAVDSPGACVFVADVVAGTVSGFWFNAAGSLFVAFPGMPVPLAPAGMAFDPVGQFLFVTASAPVDRLFSYPVLAPAPNCGLGAPANSPTGNNPVGVAVTSFGQLAYVANNGLAGSVSPYLVNPVNGAPAPNGPAKATVAPGPTAIHVDPTGNFLYVADSAGGAITGYAINLATGVPARIAVSPWPAGISPVAIATTR